MKLKLFFSLLALALFLISSLACEDEVANPDEIVFPATNVKYGTQVEPLIFRSCAFAGCHDAEARAGGYSMETWQETVGSKSGVVLAGDTVNSRLIWRVEGKFGLTRMPLDRPPLNANQIAGLKRWILEGAQNN